MIVYSVVHKVNVFEFLKTEFKSYNRDVFIWTFWLAYSVLCTEYWSLSNRDGCRDHIGSLILVSVKSNVMWKSYTQWIGKVGLCPIDRQELLLWAYKLSKSWLILSPPENFPPTPSSTHDWWNRITIRSCDVKIDLNLPVYTHMQHGSLF